MTTKQFFSRLLAAAGVALATLAGAGTAQARDVNWAVGVGAPGVSIGVNNGYPVYVSPAPVYVAPPPPPRPVYYSAPPQPIYYRTEPAYVVPAPPPGYYYREERHPHRHHHYRHGHGHAYGHDRDRWDGR